MTTAIAAPTKFETVRDLLYKARGRMQDAVPKHMTPERLIKVGIAALSRNPILLECTPESLILALIECGQLGLEPGPLGKAHMVPFRNSRTKQREIQFIIGYQGMADLVLRTEGVDSLDARCVYEGDRFDYEYGLNQKLIHRPQGETDPNRITHAYAIARTSDGEPVFEVLSRDAIEKGHRSRSKAKDSGPWVTDYAAMCKKTVVLVLCKLLRKSPELEAAIAHDYSVEVGSPSPLAQLDPGYGEAVEPPAKKTKTEETSRRMTAKKEDPPVDLEGDVYGREKLSATDIKDLNANIGASGIPIKTILKKWNLKRIEDVTKGKAPEIYEFLGKVAKGALGI